MSHNTDRSRPYAAAGAGGGDYRARLASGLGARFFGRRLEGLGVFESFGCLFSSFVHFRNLGFNCSLLVGPLANFLRLANHGAVAGRSSRGPAVS
jgi:hypothetical protein